MIQAIGVAEFKQRRKNLVEQIKKNYPSHEGAVLLFAGFEHEHARFRQESSFYYFTGVQEPGIALWLELDGHATLFIPNHGTTRSKWVLSGLEVTEEKAQESGVDRIEYLGEQCDGYQLYPFFTARGHQQLIARIQKNIHAHKYIFSLNPTTPFGYVEQRFVLERINTFLPGFLKQVIEISPLVASLRRVKTMRELEQLYKAIEITEVAHEAVAQVIKPGEIEYKVQAVLEFVFTESGASRPAFPSIVGSGKNSTVLHYNQNNRVMEAQDLVVVDIGAEYNYYCADITRTYPVSGTFTARQREIYELVLATQEYIASVAQPGYWLSNKEQPEKSLNHLARAYLKEHGYDQYCPHGIGHFLGIDVHDVGDPLVPLQEGDVITIEPGIYIPEESLGVRIEDNYWIVKEGAVCLSEDLPKEPEDIEEMVQEASEWKSELLQDNKDYEA
jgi:Xaa-Pro aminopeptidase